MSNYLKSSDGVFHLSGELDFNTVPQIWKSSATMFASKVNKVVVDLHGVTRADSAGLALLVGWVRHANAAGVEAEFRNIPEQLLVIARVSGVEAMLPMSAH